MDAPNLLHTQRVARVQRKRIVLTLVAVYVAFAYWTVQQDDAYIFYSYARNIIDGVGYVFNAGEPVNATTSALYTLLLAAIAFPIPSALPIVAHLIGAVSLAGIGLISLDLLDEDSITAFLFPLLLLTHPWLHRGTGMETFLTLYLTLCIFAAYKADRVILAAALAALAFLARPDTALASFVVGVDYLWNRRTLPPMRAIIVGLAIPVPWLVFSYLYFGDVLPSTLAVKSAQSGTGYWGTGLIFLQGFIPGGGLIEKASSYSDYAAAIAAVSVVAAMTPHVLRFTGVRLVLLWNVLYFAVYAFVLNPPAYPWYYVPFTSGMALVVAQAASALWRTALRPLIILGMVCALLVPLAIARYVAPSNKYSTYRAVATWLNEYAQKGDALASAEIGVLRYYYQHGPIIDTLGLVDPAIARSIERRDYGWFVESYKPEWILVRSPLRRILEEYAQTDAFLSQYRAAEVEFRGYTLYHRVVQSQPVGATCGCPASTCGATPPLQSHDKPPTMEGQC